MSKDGEENGTSSVPMLTLPGVMWGAPRRGVSRSGQRPPCGWPGMGGAKDHMRESLGSAPPAPSGVTIDMG